ncbi:MAG: choice-of-anchor D domain-containing protein, partial [Burkholderiaceae bacterium]
METLSTAKPFAIVKMASALCMVLALWMLVSFATSAAPLTINVIGVSATGVQTPITGAAVDYRWTVEEDATKLSIPGQPATSANLSLSMHRSYMPVVAAGRAGAASVQPPTQDPDVLRVYSQLPSNLNLDPAKRYYVSVAQVGYQMGAAPVVFSGGGATATATVYVNEYQLPAAQIAVQVFEDNAPLNGAPNVPEEPVLAGFTVKLIEAGGTYGMSGGEVTQDGFGNPLGTTYSDSNGTVLERGKGIVLTGADGTATIKNLFPGKYTILVNPPVGSDWHQTSTIEGTRGQDAWVKNNEPQFFQEFGPPGAHVFVGFTRSGCIQGPSPIDGSRCAGLEGGTPRTITGRVVNNHNSRPPVYTFFKGAPVTECWVGLNQAPAGPTLYTKRCEKNGTFSITGVPAGTYELVAWDDPLDMIIGTTTITVGGTNLALGDISLNSWFGRYQGRVFQDIDGTGLPFFGPEGFNRPYIEVDPVTGEEFESTKTYGPGELKPPFGEGIANNIRFRDGSIYQAVNTKADGTFAFTEVFPFFNYLVGEIDYARFKASGATIVVDDGGEINATANASKLWNAQPGLFGGTDPALAYNPWTRLNPQCQEYNTAGACTAYYRTENCGPPGPNGETGQCAILLEAMQVYLGQTNHIEWGKQPYRINENGGIAGIIHYAITRAENDPRFAAAEEWEPGIARVQVNVFLDCDGDSYPDKPLNDGSGQCSALSSGGYQYDKPDVDNYPFCWRDPDGEFATNLSLCPNGQAMGPEDVKRSTTGGTSFSFGDVFRWGAPGEIPTQQPEIGLAGTDSWDSSIPTGCQGTPYTVPSTGEALDCFDGLRNFNQVVPSVFDGGYAFGRVAGQAEMPTLIGVQGKGTYIIEAVAPPGYLHQGNGDANVAFGDALQSSTAALPFECVGMELAVPEYLTLFPGEPNPNYTGSGQTWRKCDMKAVPLLPGQNPPPDFWMYTEAPVSGHGVGFILDDTASEFNTYAPNFGEKYAPPHLPVSIQDWTGREISRVYSDQYGSYNFLVPSSFTINPPFPSGVMPSMMVACMNHPGPIVDPNDPTQTIIDPFFNRRYTQFCYTFQYLAGKTTYLDTPVLPIAAFAAADKNPLDCECDNGTPTIYSATNGSNGPWAPTGAGTSLTIVSMGTTQVVNPAFDPTVLFNATVGATPPTGYTYTTNPADTRLQKSIARDYGFGNTEGSVTLNGTAISPANVSWSNGVITATLPSGTGQQQLMITRADNGKQSVVGLTVHRSATAPRRVNLSGSDSLTCGLATPCKTIQAAVDAASAGELITVAPGTYNEYVIMDKRVQLQGWGAGSVTINAAKSSAGGLTAWRERINSRVFLAGETPTPGQTIELLAGQTLPAFGAQEGPGILVAGRSGTNNGCLGTQALRIDGLTVTGSDSGGGILANGYACGLQVANNRVVGNYGTYGGGVRIGHSELVFTVAGDIGNSEYTDAVNRSTNVHHNWISQNGATEAGGSGGVTMGTGSNGYSVANNYICGNFSMADGGGMSHLGLSTGSNQISQNKFIFNQTFNQLADPTGGGLFIGGQIPVGASAATGTGDVTVNANLFQGNQAGAGAGGAVSIARTLNGDDVNLTNNMIVNNVAAYAGGGVVLTDIGNAVRVVNNTIASNVSTASNRQAGASGSAPSTPQVAGLSVLSGNNNPLLFNNITWGNRSYIYLINGLNSGLCNPQATSIGAGGVCAPAGSAQYRDLGRVAGSNLTPTNSVLTTGGILTNVTSSGTNSFVASNSTSLFISPNSFASIIDPTQPVALPETTVLLQSALTFDEGGNFVNVIFSPLTLWDANGLLRADYHIQQASVPVNAGATSKSSYTAPTTDFDLQTRTGNRDIGADEFFAAPSAALTGGPLNFGSVQVGSTSAIQTLTITNTGNVALSGTPSFSITQFSAPTPVNPAGGTCYVLSSLAPGASCTVNVRFQPTAATTYTGTFSVTTSPSSVVLGSPVTLIGTGFAPPSTASVTPNPLAFGNRATGTSSTLDLTVTNTGSVALAGGSFTFGGGTPQPYSRVTTGTFPGGAPNCGTGLAIGATCTVRVQFLPTTAASFSRTLTVAYTGATVTPASVSLTGT